MRLFPKLFLWFLAANLVSLAISMAVILPIWSDLAPHYNAREQGAEALEIYQTGGQKALRAWLRHRHATGEGKGMLYNDEGEPALPRRSSRRPHTWQPQLAEMLAGTDEFKLPRGGRLVAATVTGEDGKLWRWIAHPKPPPEPPWPLLLLRTTTGLLILLLAAWWLARHLSKPLASLQYSSKELARGNLSSRVPNKLTTGRDEVAGLGRDFNHMADRLQTSLQSHQQLLADVSHELRSPLGRLQLAVELARDADGPRAAVLLERISTEGDRLESMIADVLTISKLENAAKKKPINTQLLMENLLADSRFEAQNRNLTINSETLPITLNANEELLRRAIENVLRNAIKYSATGGVIEVIEQQVNDAIHITISDNGPGVPTSELQNLFKPFYRVTDARERTSGSDGYGLGLAIAARAVTSHGGSITAQNRQAGGLEVTISLPLQPKVESAEN